MSQQDGYPLHAQLQHVGVQHSSTVMDPELAKARRLMQEKIFQLLAQRQRHTNEIPQRKIADIVRRLEEGLFMTAATKEEYLNLDTLESRLHAFIKRPRLSSNNAQHSQFVNSFAPVGTMIPTPGMRQHGNSNLMVSSSVDNSVVSAGTCNSMSSSVSNQAAVQGSKKVLKVYSRRRKRLDHGWKLVHHFGRL